MPDDETVAQVELADAMEGEVEPEILRAFSMEEVREILAELSD